MNVHHHFSSMNSNNNSAAAAATTSSPLPGTPEVERRFEEILKKMDLPPNKAKVLRAYSVDKKWELVCDQEKVTDQGAPAVYLDKLKLYLDPKGTKKKKKILGDENSTIILKHLETSLRTNSIDWVREFLSDQNNGLKILVHYLKHAQESGGLRLPPHCQVYTNGGGQDHNDSSTISLNNNFFGQDLLSTSLTSKKLKILHANMSGHKNLHNGQPEDDIHVCIQCLRAIMNNTYGFNMVFNDNEAIYCLVCSILHPSLRTKASVLILLAAICLVKGGHELIVNAFDRFKLEFRESNRFQTLFTFFRDPEEFHVDFMVACMQFINIVVHSVEDKNYRIFLQHEFKLLGLDDYVEANEKIQEVEANYVMQIVRLDNRLAELAKERETLMSLQQRADNDLNTLRRVLSQKEQESQQKQFRLESRINELEELQKSLKTGLSNLSSGESSSPPHPPAPAPPPPAPPIPSTLAPPPPPPAAFLLANNSKSNFAAPDLPNTADFGAVTIKRRIPTKYKLPQLNWTALKPNQLKGTVFSELDDDRIIEDEVKNLSFDLQILDAENVEILLRVLPTAEEVKSYRDYETSQKSIDALSEEDKFLIQLSKVERLSQKLQIMSFMANFKESIELLNPSLTTIIAASKSVKDAKRFHKILEVILAFGNYMNSAKRGGVYGFKLQSLDILPFLKAPGSKSYTLLHTLALTIREKFPELLKFTDELKFVEKASAISLDAIMVDYTDLEKLYDLTKKEYALRANDAPQVLGQFLANVDSMLADLRTNTRVAQEAFRSCVEFYGETAKGTTTSAFFTVLMNFCKHFTQADEENESRRKAE
uniref:Formin-like protein n=1 Tax=Romanomermis culicivorax TaxID=13658 RepID=A0A915KV00_ROMCU